MRKMITREKSRQLRKGCSYLVLLCFALNVIEPSIVVGFEK